MHRLRLTWRGLVRRPRDVLAPPESSARFDHSWAAWTEHRVELPPAEVVRRFLEELASSGPSRRGLRF